MKTQRLSINLMGVMAFIGVGTAALGQDTTPEGTPPGSVSVAPPVVRGTISDAEGPVAGATVLIEVQDMGIRRVVFRTRARTDSEGHYEADLSKVDAPTLGIQVNAVEKSHAEGMKIEMTDKRALPIDISMELEPGFSVSGHVYGDSGKPVAGARVEVPYVRPAESQFDGFYTVEGVHLTYQFTIQARASGYSPQTRLIDLSSTNTIPEVDFHLKPERTVCGRVTGPDGKPVEGAEVNIYLPLQRAWRTTDSKGEFSIGDLPYEASKGLILVSHPDFAPYREETVIGEGNTTLTMQLDRGGILEGLVKDMQGKPVAGATVQMSVPEAAPEAVDRTNPEGHFRAANLPPGDVIVTIVPGDEALQRNGELLLDQTESKLNGNIDPWPDERASDFDGIVQKDQVTMKRRDRASGEEAKPDSPAAAEYTGTLSSDGLSMKGRYKALNSDRTGGWEATRENGDAKDLSGLWEWKETLDPPKFRLAPARKKAEIGRDEKKEIEFTLTPGWTLEGSVATGDGKAVKDARIRVALWDKSPADLAVTESDAQGKFHLENLPSGDLVVSAVQGEYGAKSLSFDKPPEPNKKTEFVLGWTEPTSGGGLSKAEDMFAGSPEAGSKAPEFVAQALDGSTVDLSKLKGKVVLLDFWASWCGPCVGELPTLKSVYSRFHDTPEFFMVSVSLDFNESDLRGAIKEHGIAWPQIYDGKGWETELGKKYGVMAIPRLFLIDRKGNVISNTLRGEAILKAVEDALKGP